MIKAITVKDFDYFVDRSVSFITCIWYDVVGALLNFFVIKMNAFKYSAD